MSEEHPSDTESDESSFEDYDHEGASPILEVGKGILSNLGGYKNINSGAHLRNNLLNEWRSADEHVKELEKDAKPKPFPCTTLIPVFDINSMSTENEDNITFPVKFCKCQKYFSTQKEHFLHFVAKHCDIIFGIGNVSNASVYNMLLNEYPNLRPATKEKKILCIPYLKCRSCLSSLKIPTWGSKNGINMFLLDPVKSEDIQEYVNLIWEGDRFKGYREEASKFMRHVCSKKRSPQVTAEGLQHKFDADHCNICLFNFLPTLITWSISAVCITPTRSSQWCVPWPSTSA